MAMAALQFSGNYIQLLVTIVTKVTDPNTLGDFGNPNGKWQIHVNENHHEVGKYRNEYEIGKYTNEAVKQPTGK